LTSLAGGSEDASSFECLAAAAERESRATNGEKNRSSFESASAIATRVAENAMLDTGPAPAYAHAWCAPAGGTARVGDSADSAARTAIRTDSGGGITDPSSGFGEENGAARVSERDAPVGAPRRARQRVFFWYQQRPPGDAPAMVRLVHDVQRDARVRRQHAAARVRDQNAVRVERVERDARRFRTQIDLHQRLAARRDAQREARVGRRRRDREVPVRRARTPAR
jgi:hypothetical protein